jgi:hypothetical protein
MSRAAPPVADCHSPVVASRPASTAVLELGIGNALASAASGSALDGDRAGTPLAWQSWRATGSESGHSSSHAAPCDDDPKRFS